MQSRHQKPHHPLSHNLQKHEEEVCRENRNARGRSQSEKFNRPPCKYFLKGTCTKSPCEYWHPPECLFCKLNRDVSSVQSAHSRTGRLKNNQTKSRNKGDDKSAVAIMTCTTVELCITGHCARRFCDDFWEGHTSVGTNTTSTIHEGCIASSKHPRK